MHFNEARSNLEEAEMAFRRGLQVLGQDCSSSIKSMLWYHKIIGSGGNAELFQL